MKRFIFKQTLEKFSNKIVKLKNTIERDSIVKLCSNQKEAKTIPSISLTWLECSLPVHIGGAN